MRTKQEQEYINQILANIKNHWPSINHQIRCTRCEELLDPLKAVWLVLKISGGYVSLREGMGIPESNNQGAFPYGSACAERALNGDTDATDSQKQANIRKSLKKKAKSSGGGEGW